MEKDPAMRNQLEIGRKELAAIIDEPHSLRGRRLSAGFSQARLAELSGLTQSHIALIESGRNDPTTTTIVKLADALNTTAEHMISLILAHREKTHEQ